MADIGSARIYLIVDTEAYDQQLAKAVEKAGVFGTSAEKAFDSSSAGVRRATQRVADYIDTLGRTDAPIEKMLRKLSRMGADGAVIDTLTQRWRDQQRQIEQTAAAAEQAAVRQKAAAEQAAISAQARVNQLVAPGLDRDPAELARRRADAEAALLPLLQRQETIMSQMVADATAINVARNEAIAQASQARINQLVAPGLARETDAGYLAEQRRVVAALEQQVQLEQQVEQQAREINAEWVAIQRQIEAAGKSTYDILRMQAQQKYGDASAPLIQQINRWEKLNSTISGTNVNAKQLQQAIRFLPAQFTDIGTSLAGGMNPLLVALQQGGQIFDQFRLAGVGVGGTFKAIGAQALALINPLTLSAAALAAIAVALNEAESRTVAFNKAIISTGGFSSKSVEQLDRLAERLDTIAGVTKGKAADIIASIVQTGQIPANQLNMVAEAAARAGESGIKSAEDVVKAFQEIGKSPVDALLKLNATENFLTEAQLKRISTLEEEGRTQEAVTEAARIYFDVISSRSAQAGQNITTMGEAWRGLKRIVTETGDSIVDAVAALFEAYGDVEKRSSQMLKNQREALETEAFSIGRKQGLGYRWREQQIAQEIADIDRVLAARTKATAAQERETVNSQQATKDRADRARFLAAEVGYLSDAERKTRELASVDDLRTRGVITQAEAIKRRTQIEESYARKSRGSAPGARSAAREVRADFDIQLAQLRTQSKEVEAAYSLQEISAKKYYETLGDLARKERDIQTASVNAQIAAIAGRKGSEQEYARLRAQAVQVEEQYKQRQIDLDTQQAQRQKQYNEEYQKFVWSLEDGTEAMRQQMEADIARISIGDREFERMQARMDLERERDRRLRDIDRRIQQNADFAEEGERQKAALIEETNRKLAEQARLYAAIDQAQGDWANGASRAWANWLAEVGDVAGKAEQFFNQAFDGLADAITDLLTGSSNSFKDFFDGLARMITKFIVEQKLTEWLGSLKAGGGGGGLLDFAGNLLGALLGSGSGGNTVSYAPGGSFTWNPAVRPFAKGGVPGGTGLSDYRNQIVSQPTVFPFARGGVPNVGIMGETYRPEAIVPLTRMPGGDLGVKMDTRGGQRGPVTLNQTFVVQGTPDRSTRAQLAAKTGRESQRAILRS